MPPKISVGRHAGSTSIDINHYRPLVGDELIDELLALARRLNGVRICHLNSTAFGGGVAELLSRYLPLLQALDLSADWRIIHGTPVFFETTKSFHNALQGTRCDLTEADRSVYLQANEESAKVIGRGYDAYIVHDPQPAAIRHFIGASRAKWIWRCHIDSSAPDPTMSRFLKPFIEEYDALVFTMAEFLLPGLQIKRVAFIPPAIDPLATKNMDLPIDLCKRAMADSGIDLSRPLLLQVSRFDPWKDPLGVIQAYRLVKEAVPGIQLALIGGMAGDDPEGWRLLEQIEEEAAADPDLFVFTNLGGVGSMEVNVFQRGCDLIIQKSIREGFGLVVSEALWKEKPVIAGCAGGIPMQFPEGYDRYLIDTVEECADRVLHLLKRPGERGDFGRAGREHVRKHFLLPRLLRDELRLIEDLLRPG
ncbi:MAG: glycosyltransferase [Candidatus Manganitrophus sp. SB1]|nr:glycosyltransferase [Candidatus Manganitrophus morganii]